MEICWNELSLAEMLDDPIVQTMMWRDGVEPAFVTDLIKRVQEDRSRFAVQQDA